MNTKLDTRLAQVRTQKAQGRAELGKLEQRYRDIGTTPALAKVVNLLFPDARHALLSLAARGTGHINSNAIAHLASALATAPAEEHPHLLREMQRTLLPDHKGDVLAPTAQDVMEAVHVWLSSLSQRQTVRTTLDAAEATVAQLTVDERQAFADAFEEQVGGGGKRPLAAQLHHPPRFERLVSARWAFAELGAVPACLTQPALLAAAGFVSQPTRVLEGKLDAAALTRAIGAALNTKKPIVLAFDANSYRGIYDNMNIDGAQVVAIVNDTLYDAKTGFETTLDPAAVLVAVAPRSARAFSNLRLRPAAILGAALTDWPDARCLPLDVATGAVRPPTQAEVEHGASLLVAATWGSTYVTPDDWLHIAKRLRDAGTHIPTESVVAAWFSGDMETTSTAATVAPRYLEQISQNYAQLDPHVQQLLWAAARETFENKSPLIQHLATLRMGSVLPTPPAREMHKADAYFGAVANAIWRRDQPHNEVGVEARVFMLTVAERAEVVPAHLAPNLHAAVKLARADAKHGAMSLRDAAALILTTDSPSSNSM